MSILTEIFAHKAQEVAFAKSLVSPEELLARAADAPPRKGFLRALQSALKPGLIAEVKKASPSAGVIRENFDPIDLAQVYEQAGATCLSVLTDVKYFQGSPDYLMRIREEVGLPLLRKDFIADPYQIAEAVLWGADAILLIVAGLEKSQLFDLHALAHLSGLDVLVEVHDEAECEIANELKAPLVGINNRDLRTFKTDLSTTQRLLPLLTEAQLRVSESALYSNEDVQKVHSYGADAVLIGTAFTQSDDVGAAVRTIMGAPHPHNSVEGNR